jgi:hypothetical protein
MREGASLLCQIGRPQIINLGKGLAERRLGLRLAGPLIARVLGQVRRAGILRVRFSPSLLR